MSQPKLPYAAIAALALFTSVAHAQGSTQAPAPAANPESPQDEEKGTLGAAVEKLIDAITALENTNDLDGNAADATKPVPEAGATETASAEGDPGDQVEGAEADKGKTSN
jgi:hypothetical protein